MKKKMIIGIALIIALTAITISIIAQANAEEAPSSLQSGEDSPGVHQCPRDGYDENEGPSNRNGFGGDY